MLKYKDQYGFSVLNSRRVDEIDATLVEMIHEKSGAHVIFLDRADENKTFAIGFRTIPTDDTGVFHILEHSVLCGSEKFPVKDPFTELIKGSVSTYLNAFTYGDKTVYPVSSKNDKALLGLISVYLDAVLHPNAIKNPYIFMQEGHRYEITEDGHLTINGVVYNEMKGAYSSADGYADYLISRLVSPGGTYSYDSGGNPDFIPDLTYDSFKAAHKKFYHPSNACIFLDGSVNLQDVLPLIDSYLAEYDAVEPLYAVDDGGDSITEPLVASYPIEKEESTENKSRIYLCHNSFPHCERNKNAALSLIAEAIADSNNAPLTKKILKSGLCESFSFYSTSSYSLNVLNAIFIGVKDGKIDELLKLYNDSVKEILEEGIPKENLTSALGRLEFSAREADFGSYPRGMVYMTACMEYALLNDDPISPLEYNKLFDFLREKINTGYFNDLLKEVILTPNSTLILTPDPEFNTKKDEELARKLDRKLSQMSNEERDELIKNNEAFTSWQETEDTEEALNSIPKLTLDDLKAEPEEIPTEVSVVDNTTVISHKIHSSKIVYGELFFDASDIDAEDLPYLRLFAEMMPEWDTKLGDASHFRNRAKRHLGALHMVPTPIKCGHDAKIYLMTRISYLETEEKNALALLEEQLYYTRFDNEELLKQNVRQLYTASMEYIINRGDSIAMMRNAAKHSKYDAITDALYGYTYHAFIKNLSDRISADADSVIAKLEEIRAKYLLRGRLTLGITAEQTDSFAKGLILSVKPGGKGAGACKIDTISKTNDAIAIPATISYCARGANLNGIDENLYTGSFSILTNILSYEILWNEIRVRGGAYDTGFVARSNSGTIGFYSFRDPSPERTNTVFANSHLLVKEFLDTSPDLLKYKIGCIGAADNVSTPRGDGSTATKLYLSGKSHKDILKARRESISTTLDDLYKLVDILEKINKDATSTVVAPRDTISGINGIDVILDI